MGQFQSKEYDGDPYVDLMRALPERELIWWVQKAIWVSAVLLLCAVSSFVQTLYHVEQPHCSL